MKTGGPASRSVLEMSIPRDVAYTTVPAMPGQTPNLDLEENANYLTPKLTVPRIICGVIESHGGEKSRPRLRECRSSGALISADSFRPVNP
jgi:hypothetical protein